MRSLSPPKTQTGSPPPFPPLRRHHATIPALLPEARCGAFPKPQYTVNSWCHSTPSPPHTHRHALLHSAANTPKFVTRLTLLPIPPRPCRLFRSSRWLRPQHTCLPLWLPDVRGAHAAPYPAPPQSNWRFPLREAKMLAAPSSPPACPPADRPHPHPDSHPHGHPRRSARRTCRERGGGGEQQESLAGRRAQRSGHGHTAAAPGLQGPRAELGGRGGAGRFEVPGPREGSTAPAPF